MSEPRYVKIYGAGRERRLEIRESGAFLVFAKQERVSDAEWRQEGFEFTIPIAHAGDIGDVTAALTILWDGRRMEEMAEREAKAKL